MSNEPRNKDDVKGRVKEAAGNLTGDEDMEREGKLDQAVGGVKDAVDNVADKTKGLLGKNDENH